MKNGSISMVLVEGKSLQITIPEEIGKAALYIENYNDNILLRVDEALSERISIPNVTSKPRSVDINNNGNSNADGNMLIVINEGQALFLTTPEEVGKAFICINYYQGYINITGDAALFQKLCGPTILGTLKSDIRNNSVGSSIDEERYDSVGSCIEKTIITIKKQK